MPLTSVLFLPPVEGVALSWRDLTTLALFACVGVVITMLNVARVRSRELAEQRQRWLAITLRSIGDAVIATDRDGKIRFVNPVAERLTGWPASDAEGRKLTDVFRIVNEPTRAPVENPVDKVVRERRVIGLANHTLLLARDGREYVIEDSGAPIIGDDGELIGIVLVFRDSTRKSRDTARKEMLARTSTMLASSLDYQLTLQRVVELAIPTFADWCTVHVLEPDGAIRLVGIHHRDPEKVECGRELGRRFPQDPTRDVGVPNVLRTGRPEWLAEIPDVMLVGIAHDAEHLGILRRLGLRSYIMVPLTARGETIGVLTFATAESGRRYEQSDLPFAEELAGRAAMAVENATLYAKARDAVKIRDEFLSIASHELKTPLATLQLQLDLMADTIASNERLAREMDVAHRQTLRLGSLVETLLEVTRLTGERIALEREELDLVHLVDEVVHSFEPSAALARSELTFDPEVERLVGSWDRVRLEQVISSLIDNALKYGAGGPVLVVVSEDDGFARVLVRDRGIGIAKEDAMRIFGRFERAVSTRHYGGFGLGLYIANEIVRAHGGRIHVGTRAEAGSDFTVILPIASDEQRAVPHEERVQ